MFIPLAAILRIANQLTFAECLHAEIGFPRAAAAPGCGGPDLQQQRTATAYPQQALSATSPVISRVLTS